MTVINSAILLVRRINETQRRRDALVDRLDMMRRGLPEWTFEPLQLVGMSSQEIRSAMSDLSRAESDAGIGEVEKEIEKLDARLEELENLLLSTPARSLDCAQAILDLAIQRFRSQTTNDPNDLFYDYGDARVLRFLERAAEEMRTLMAEDERAYA